MDEESKTKCEGRMRTFDELKDYEKIERCREEIKRNQSSLARMGRLIDKLFRHRHDSDGKLLAELNQYDDLGGKGIPSGDF